MNDLTLCAAIPTHNRPVDIQEAVASVKAQGGDIEIIVVDDGSEPKVDPGSLPDDVSLVRHNVPKGPAGARNAAVDAATAEWIAFLDDDDRWLPGKVAALSDVLLRFEDAAVVYHRTGYVATSSRRKARRIRSPVKRVLRHQPPHLSGVAVRRDIHQAVRFDEAMWATQDLDYLIRLAFTGAWVEIPRILSVHTSRSRQDSVIDLDSRIEGRLSLLDRHGQLIRGDRIAHSFFYARLGHQYRRANDTKAAHENFLRALRINPANRVALLGLVRLYLPTQN